jgi:hypothetical protein
MTHRVYGYLVRKIKFDLIIKLIIWMDWKLQNKSYT